jgi:hypothetical protein
MGKDTPPSTDLPANLSNKIRVPGADDGINNPKEVMKAQFENFSIMLRIKWILCFF